MKIAPEIYTLTGIIQPCPAALERVLRVIRVRGFLPVHSQLSLQDRQYIVEIGVQATRSGERCIHNLIAQLRKLQDVTRLEMATQQTEQLTTLLANTQREFSVPKAAAG